MNADDTLYGRVKNGVLTISGNGSSITVDGGGLVISDGAYGQSAQLRFRRADCPVSRIVVTRPDGVISFAAIKWLHGVGVGLVQLDWDGTVLLATAPRGIDQPAMRRAQALATNDDMGLALVREIIRAKLNGQAEVSRLLGSEDTVAPIARFAGELDGARDPVQIRGVEAMAAAAYWQAWQMLPLHFARQHRVPEHWQFFGSRHSSVTGMPRKAMTPGNAVLNYLYGLAACEMTIALTGVGLDPGIGIFHADRVSRPSLTYDAMEPIRPYVDAWLAAWLNSAHFSKRDFHEDSDGNIRITRPLTSHLAMTVPIWRQTATSVAHWLAQSLTPRGTLERGYACDPPRPLSAFPAPNRIYSGAQRAGISKTCPECGGVVAYGYRKFCSPACADSFFVASTTVTPLRSISDVGTAAHGQNQRADVMAGRAEKNRRHLVMRRAWEVEHASGNDLSLSRSSSATGNSFGSSRLRYGGLGEWFAAELTPLLALRRTAEIRGATGLSVRYAIMIRHGYVPHPRHFTKLAELVGVAAPQLMAATG